VANAAWAGRKPFAQEGPQLGCMTRDGGDLLALAALLNLPGATHLSPMPITYPLLAGSAAVYRAFSSTHHLCPIIYPLVLCSGMPPRSAAPFITCLPTADAATSAGDGGRRRRNGLMCMLYWWWSGGVDGVVVVGGGGVGLDVHPVTVFLYLPVVYGCCAPPHARHAPHPTPHTSTAHALHHRLRSSGAARVALRALPRAPCAHAFPHCLLPL